MRGWVVGMTEVARALKALVAVDKTAGGERMAARLRAVIAAPAMNEHAAMAALVGASRQAEAWLQLKAPAPADAGDAPDVATGDNDEAGEPDTGIMVALFLAPALAAKVALDGGEPADELHVTLAYLGDSADMSADLTALLPTVVAGWAASTPPLAGEISGVGLFTAGPKPVTYLSVDVPGLSDEREELVDALVAAGMPVIAEHGFTPHCTLAYADRTDEVPAGGQAVRFDSVALVIAEEQTDFPLTGAPGDND